MKRLPDWKDRFRRFLEANRARPFRWGAWDCCLFAVNGVRAITGVDLAAQYRGRYHTWLGATRILGGDMLAFVDAVAKENRIARHADFRDASPGDVVMAHVGERPTLGLANPIRLAVFATQDGLAEFPYSVVTHAWKVG
jgi:hypothetical protein